MTSDPRFAGWTEMAAHFGIAPQAVQHWAQRRDDFPAPLARLSMGPVYDLNAVIAWKRDHPPRKRGRPVGRVTACEHTDRRHKSLGLCDPCYWQLRVQRDRARKASTR